MAITRDFRKTILERAQSDPEFRRGLLLESMELINSGDFTIGRAMLRNYINATLGFQQLAKAVNIPPTSLQRMFGPNGNPRAQNLFGILAYLQQREGIRVHLQSRPAATAVA